MPNPAPYILAHKATGVHETFPSFAKANVSAHLWANGASHQPGWTITGPNHEGNETTWHWDPAYRVWTTRGFRR